MKRLDGRSRPPGWADFGWSGPNLPPSRPAGDSAPGGRERRFGSSRGFRAAGPAGHRGGASTRTVLRPSPDPRDIPPPPRFHRAPHGHPIHRASPGKRSGEGGLGEIGGGRPDASLRGLPAARARPRRPRAAATAPPLRARPGAEIHRIPPRGFRNRGSPAIFCCGRDKSPISSPDGATQERRWNMMGRPCWRKPTSDAERADHFRACCPSSGCS